MKVLQINAVNGIKSTGRNTQEIASFLYDNGHEGYIAYSEGVDYEYGYKIGNSLEKKIHALFSRISGKQGYFSRKGTKKLIGFIEKINPDVIHFGNLHGNFIHLELILKHIALKNIPLVLTLHDCWFYTGKCSHYTIDGCYRWENECGNCIRLAKDNPSWILDRTQKMHKDKKEWFSRVKNLAVVGVSDWITNEAKCSLLSSATTIKRIYNWIDLDVFQPVSSKLLREKYNLEGVFVILGVASKWLVSKGLDKFNDLSNILPANMKIVLVGQIGNAIQLSTKIIHINETHDAYELAQFYSLADVLLNPSLEESFGKVTVESMACGTPVIVTNSTASPELVGDKCGYILEDMNLTNIFDTLNLIKSDGKLFYSKHCVSHTHKNFAKDKILNDYLELYESISNGG